MRKLLDRLGLFKSAGLTGVGHYTLSILGCGSGLLTVIKTVEILIIFYGTAVVKTSVPVFVIVTSPFGSKIMLGGAESGEKEICCGSKYKKYDKSK